MSVLDDPESGCSKKGGSHFERILAATFAAYTMKVKCRQAPFYKIGLRIVATLLDAEQVWVKGVYSGDGEGLLLSQQFSPSSARL